MSTTMSRDALTTWTIAGRADRPFRPALDLGGADPACAFDYVVMQTPDVDEIAIELRPTEDEAGRLW